MPAKTSQPTSLPTFLRDPRGPVRRTVRRLRRPIAAALAGLATLLALAALRGSPAEPPSPAAGPTASSGTSVPGHVTVPVALASGAIAAVLQVGDVIDLVGTTDVGGSIGNADSPVTVIARGARVIDLAGSGSSLGGSALGGSASAVILVSLPEADAIRVVTAVRDGLTPIIRSR